jgi:hypothetical protein
VRKVFRCLDDVEFENQGTLIDVVNHALSLADKSNLAKKVVFLKQH